MPQYKQLGVHWGSDADYALLNREMDQSQGLGRRRTKRPIFMGEFGAYENGAMADRVKSTPPSPVLRKRAVSPGHWQFDKDFIVYDISKDAWVEPILHALIPPNDKLSEAR